VLTILDGNRFLVCDDLGDVEGGVDGLYSDDTRHLSRWVMRVNGRRPKLLSSGLRDHASAVIYAQHDVGTPSQPSPLATVRELFISAGALQERLVLENHGTGLVSVVVRYEFDCDFLDLFEVKSQSFGERDLAFAKTITPLRTSRITLPASKLSRWVSVDAVPSLRVNVRLTTALLVEAFARVWLTLTRSIVFQKPSYPCRPPAAFCIPGVSRCQVRSLSFVTSE